MEKLEQKFHKNFRKVIRIIQENINEVTKTSG